MYGGRVFKAVLEAQETESSVSLHLVDSEYDTGAVIRQCKVAILPDDSLERLQARVRAREKEFVVESLAQIAQGQITLSPTAG
jgi:phosphoribosylglycinamide formyltransferase 1